MIKESGTIYRRSLITIFAPGIKFHGGGRLFREREAGCGVCGPARAGWRVSPGTRVRRRLPRTHDAGAVARDGSLPATSRGTRRRHRRRC